MSPTKSSETTSPIQLSAKQKENIQIYRELFTNPSSDNKYSKKRKGIALLMGILV
ncbi:MAG: hypothetical protein AB4372_07825 [Xenococcus sp. (in: cyanobacteria)]